MKGLGTLSESNHLTTGLERFPAHEICDVFRIVHEHRFVVDVHLSPDDLRGIAGKWIDFKLA